MQTAQAGKRPADRDAQLLDKLARLWAAHNKRSLEIRLETGRLLNARLGDPTQRQLRGRSLLKQAAETLQMAASELNRMRWYGHFSKDEKSCWGDIPHGRRSWTKFKEILPSLIAAVKGDEKRQRLSGDRKSTVGADGLLRLLSSATSKLGTANFTVDGRKKEELIGRLREFADAVSNACGVRFHVETEDDATGRGLNKAESGCPSSLCPSQGPVDPAAV